jgi:hypothetical protein
MNAKKATGIIFITLTVGAVLYDIWTCVFNGVGTTFSPIFLTFATAHTSLPFAIGVLIGHLTWPQSTPLSGSKRVVALGSTIAAALALLILDWQSILPHVTPVAPVVVGLLVGHFSWAQKEQGIV